MDGPFHTDHSMNNLNGIDNFLPGYCQLATCSIELISSKPRLFSFNSIRAGVLCCMLLYSHGPHLQALVAGRH
jgi:hypothetical protein